MANVRWRSRVRCAPPRNAVCDHLYLPRYCSDAHQIALHLNYLIAIAIGHSELRCWPPFIYSLYVTS